MRLSKKTILTKLAFKIVDKNKKQKGVKKMIIMQKLYTKTFDSREKAENFISQHERQDMFYLGWDLSSGIKWTVSKYKNLLQQQ
jgi:hypothetical protein